MMFSLISLLAVFSLASLSVSAGPAERRSVFTLQNGKDAQALNAKFQSLRTDSACKDNDVGCINGAFAKCANGRFVVTPCGGGLTCVALPLVNSKGTSVTCDTEADAETRITATGATGGLTGRSVKARDSFTLSNGQEAQQKNAQFSSLSANSPCQSGENACIDGDFAQCSNGKFVRTPCAGGLKCVALPLVLSKGTSITCDTEADAKARIAATGATGGLTGKREIAARADAQAPPACTKKAKRNNLERRSSSGIAKRIAQTDLPAVAQSWQDLCLKSGGDIQTNTPCVTLAGDKGISALLANADPCAQQDNADAMVDFAKSAGVTNKDALIQNAVAYAQHPRNALNINGVVPSTPFCRKAPKNSELKGLTRGQLNGVNPGLFGSPALGIFAFGDDRSCPFPQKPDVSTCTCH